MTTTVGADGFELTLGDVTAVGHAGVAPEGTDVALESVGQPTGGDLNTVLTNLGSSISLTLGDGLQPAIPIGLRFKINTSAISAEEWSNDATLVIVTESDDGTVGLLETARDGEYLTATTEHLTRFQPTQLNLAAALAGARDFVMQSLGLERPAPDCVGESAKAASGIEYKISYRGAVHPCISADGDTITVSLYAATMMPYRANSWPEVTGGTVTSPDGEGMLMALANKWVPSASGGVLMGGGASAQFDFSASNPPQFLEARQDAHMLIGAVLLNLIGIILNPLGGGAAFMDKVGQLDCLSGVVSAGRSETFDAATAAELFRTTLACAGTLSAAASFPIRLALGLIGAIPALFAGTAVGLYNEFTGRAVERINIEPDVIPWAISADGIGPFEVGETTWDDAEALPGFDGDASYFGFFGGCISGGWFGVGTIYDGVSVLVAGPEATPGTLDVVSLGAYFRTSLAASVPASTADGIQLGTSQDDVEKLYPNIVPQPHQLNDQLLEYRVENGTGRAMVFRVEDSVVSYISVGNIPQVYAVEGCA